MLLLTLRSIFVVLNKKLEIQDLNPNKILNAPEEKERNADEGN